MRTILKSGFYNILCPLLLFLRADVLLRRLSSHRRLIIMYHGITRTNLGAINGRHLTVAQFERQLIYYKKNFNILPLVDLLLDTKSEGKTNGKYTIALTFDDGYLNNVVNAAPLLEKYGIPATFFISSEALTEAQYIQPSDYLDLINHSATGTLHINGIEFRKSGYQMVSVSKGISAYEFVSTLSLSSFRSVFADLRHRFPYTDVTRNVSSEFYETINRDRLAQLQKSTLMTIGSHGHSHVNLASFSEDEVAQQLRTAKDVLSECGVATWYILAYPFGSFNEKVLRISRELGYRALIAGGSVDAQHASAVFPRLGIRNLASFAFNILSLNNGFRRFGF